jgi:hypothetical protein
VKNNQKKNPTICKLAKRRENKNTEKRLKVKADSARYQDNPLNQYFQVS